MTREIMLSLIANRMGSEYTVTSSTTQQRNFRVPTTTRTLSNSTSNTNNQIGYSSGIVCLYLLDSPVALTGTGALKWDLMIRFDLTLIGPCSGFLDFATSGGSGPDPGPTPGPTPTPTSSFTITMLASHADDIMTDGVWLNNHSGDSWLAGGYYLRFPDTRPSQVVADAQDGRDIVITGNPQCFAVYRCSVVAQGMTNDQIEYPIVWWATWHDVASKVIQVVGFKSSDKNYAQSQVRKEEGAIPHGHQLCLCYTTQQAAALRWKDVFKITLWDAFSYATNSLTNDLDTNYQITFTLVYTTKYTTPVYPNTNRVLANPTEGLGDTEASGFTLRQMIDDFTDSLELDDCPEPASEVAEGISQTPTNDEPDAGFLLAANCASSHSSDGSKQRSFSCQASASLETFQDTLLQLLSGVVRSPIIRPTPTSSSPQPVEQESDSYQELQEKYEMALKELAELPPSLLTQSLTPSRLAELQTRQTSTASTRL